MHCPFPTFVRTSVIPECLLFYNPFVPISREIIAYRHITRYHLFFVVLIFYRIRRRINTMGLNCGIVGLPNVGKSTIFNALTSAKAASANYPFCTIDPNKGVVAVPDQRLDKIAEIITTEKIVPTTVEFVDIAGLVKGASHGEGLGNQFLGHIKNVNATFQRQHSPQKKSKTYQAEGSKPSVPLEIINTELI